MWPNVKYGFKATLMLQLLPRSYFGSYILMVFRPAIVKKDSLYLGQSLRQFWHTLKEHQTAVSTLNKRKSALAEHVCDTKHAIAWENSTIITTSNRYGQNVA
jgi:hypothetical protein